MGRIVWINKRDFPLRSVQCQAEARKSLQATGQLKVFTKIRPPSLPPVGINSSPAAEGGAEFKVNHPPVLVVNSNPTDPLLACAGDDTMVADKIRQSNQERRFPECSASKIA